MFAPFIFRQENAMRRTGKVIMNTMVQTASSVRPSMLFRMDSASRLFDQLTWHANQLGILLNPFNFLSLDHFQNNTSIHRLECIVVDWRIEMREFRAQFKPSGFLMLVSYKGQRMLTITSPGIGMNDVVHSYWMITPSSAFIGSGFMRKFREDFDASFLQDGLTVQKCLPREERTDPSSAFMERYLMLLLSEIALFLN